MDFLFDESREDKLIESYLFGGAKCSTFGVDQQFAKPIQDEDIFGIDEVQGDNALNDSLGSTDINHDQDLELESHPFGGIGSEILYDRSRSPEIMFDDDIVSVSKPTPNFSKKTAQPQIDIDQVFLDDYSQSSNSNQLLGKSGNIENTRPSKDNPNTKLPPPLTPAQIKMKQMKEKLKLQAQSLAIKPRKLGSGFNKDGTLEITIDRLVSDTNSKFIFNKMFNKSKKANDSKGTPERAKRTWSSYKDSLRKRICLEKRKVWDSFNQPIEAFDDEEELIEESARHTVKVESDEESDADHPYEEKEEDELIEDEEIVTRKPRRPNISDDDDDDYYEEEQAVSTESEESEPEKEVEVHSEIETGDEEVYEAGKNDLSDDNDTNVNIREEETHQSSAYSPTSDQEASCSNNNPAELSEDESDVESDENQSAFRLDLEESSNESLEGTSKKKHRAIFIDDEASED